MSLTGGVTGAGQLELQPGSLSLAADAAYAPAETRLAGGLLALAGAGSTGRLISAWLSGGPNGPGT